MKRLLLNSLVASMITMITSNISASLVCVDMLAYMKHLREMSEHCLQLTLTQNQRKLSSDAQEREINMCELVAAELEVYTAGFAEGMKKLRENNNALPLEKLTFVFPKQESTFTHQAK